MMIPSCCCLTSSDEQLCRYLSKLLEGKRYLVVIDNLICAITWSQIKSSFPDNKNGSRLLFTNSSFIENTIVNFNGKMFDHVIFGEGSCPQELEIVKLDILYYSGGSPQAVIMVAKYLSTIDQTMDNWLKVHRCLKDNVDTVLKDRIPSIILALLEASEDIDTIDTEETPLYSVKIDPTISSHHKTGGEKENIPSVGFEECFERLLSDLVQSSPQIQILAIVGMAGIGKTTLAKRIFYSPCVSNHFHPRAWVKISQVYCRRDLLLKLLLGVRGKGRC
ncbi:hypothetical protein LIER_35147 [Lithospermum erythrorhizon]|uniref:NB-ARC domain-containing protein n=1 Tax=Lithospermum erythrorhizon TaxID=34254 RepID=A0AAV3NM09_LITER